MQLHCNMVQPCHYFLPCFWLLQARKRQMSVNGRSFLMSPSKHRCGVKTSFILLFTHMHSRTSVPHTHAGLPWRQWFQSRLSYRRLPIAVCKYMMRCIDLADSCLPASRGLQAHNSQLDSQRCCERQTCGSSLFAVWPSAKDVAGIHVHLQFNTRTHTSSTQTLRLTDMQTHRHTDTQTHRHTDTQTHANTRKHTQTHANTHKHTHTPHTRHTHKYAAHLCATKYACSKRYILN